MPISVDLATEKERSGRREGKERKKRERERQIENGGEETFLSFPRSLLFAPSPQSSQ